MEKLFTTKEVALYLGVSVRAVYNYIADGSLKSTKLPSGSVRIKESDLKDYIERGK